MGEERLTYFYQLKEAIGKQFQVSHPECQRPIRDWKGQEIVDFQEDLLGKVKGRISEKWFYTHIKPLENQKLPRIDMLNLLSQYVGYRNWNDFVHHQQVPQQEEILAPSIQKGQRAWIKKIPIKGSLVALVALLSLILVAVAMGGRQDQTTYGICFEDADTGEKITQQRVKLTLLLENESPRSFESDENGCLSLEIDKSQITFVLQAPYYQSDTITRQLSSGTRQETISLKTDDYALMIHLYSTSAIRDWKKRRNQLESMIADEARIFQVMWGSHKGMEIYNKAEFINKMTMPIKSLKNIEVIESVYDLEGQIRVLRFTQIEEE